MLNRLRQTDRRTGGSISGGFYNPTKTVSYGPWFTWTGGGQQTVYDFFEKKKFKKPSVNAMPQLREVQMSKLTYVPSTQTDVSYVLKLSPTTRYDLKGPSLAYAALASPTGHPIPGTLTLISQDAKVNSYLLQRAYSKMSTAEFDFGITIGEVAETASLLAKPLAGIAKLSSAAFAGCRAIYKDGLYTCVSLASNATAKQARRIMQTTRQHPCSTSLRIVDESANHWLAYKFGVLPIIDDVGKILDFKQNNVQRLLGLRIARVKGRKIDTTSVKSGKNDIFGYFRYDALYVKREIDQYFCGLYFRDKIDAPLLNFMENLGFAPWQLPSLAYELIPLSFVVDRFIDIKSFVRGNIGSLTKLTLGSYHTRKITTVFTSNIENIRFGSTDPSMRVTHNMEKPYAVATMEQMVRTVNQERPNFPVINPYWRQNLEADATNWP